MDAVLAVLEVRELCCAEDDGALRHVDRETEKRSPGETVAGGGGEQSRRNAKPGTGEDIEDGEECQMTPELQTSSNACLPSASPRLPSPRAAPTQALSIGRHTLLLTMFGQVLREEPMGSWSGRGSGASRMFMSCSHPGSSCTGTDGACWEGRAAARVRVSFPAGCAHLGGVIGVGDAAGCGSGGGGRRGGFLKHHEKDVEHGAAQAPRAHGDRSRVSRETYHFARAARFWRPRPAHAPPPPSRPIFDASP